MFGHISTEVLSLVAMTRVCSWALYLLGLYMNILSTKQNPSGRLTAVADVTANVYIYQTLYAAFFHTTSSLELPLGRGRH